MKPWYLLRGWDEESDRWARRDGEVLRLGPLAPRHEPWCLIEHDGPCPLGAAS